MFHSAAYADHSRIQPNDTGQPDLGKLPKQNFPIYEGETTRLWITQAEDYFDMYAMPSRLWVRISRMNFKGPVAR